MKTALIMPTHQLQHHGKVTRFHLVLAHQVLADKEYREFYMNRSACGDFVMLDNGAFELGASLPSQDLIRAANGVGARELVLPDVFKDCGKTIDAIDQARKEIGSPFGVRIAIVPQGGGQFEWFECLDAILVPHKWYVNTICIPKHLGKKTRAIILNQLKITPKYRSYTVHALGCNSTREAVLLNSFGHARSMDSSLPFVSSYHGQDLTDDQELPVDHPYMKRPEGFFTDYEERYPLELTMKNVNAFINFTGDTDARMY